MDVVTGLVKLMLKAEAQWKTGAKRLDFWEGHN